MFNIKKITLLLVALLSINVANAAYYKGRGGMQNRPLRTENADKKERKKLTQEIDAEIGEQIIRSRRQEVDLDPANIKARSERSALLTANRYSLNKKKIEFGVNKVTGLPFLRRVYKNPIESIIPASVTHN